MAYKTNMLHNDDEGITYLMTVVNGQMHHANSGMPSWGPLLEALSNDAPEDEVLRLLDVATAVRERFEKLSERVSLSGGTVFFDGVEQHDAVTTQILRFMDSGVDRWEPLVAYMENIAANLTDHSRNQLFEWLSRRDVTITPDGKLVLYKGVQSDGNGGWQSIFTGPAVVDGKAVNGHVPNAPGSTIEMPADKVHHDPSVGCASGLHAGTYEYASGFSQGAVLEVHVNPRDVRSVPTDCDAQKIRCTRYQVVDVIEVPYTSPVLDYDESDYDDWDEGDESYGADYYSQDFEF